MLESLGLVPRVRPANVDETPAPGEPPEKLALRLARTKAAAVADAQGLCVLAADTVVVLEDSLLGKPLDEKDARNMWRRLSGHNTPRGDGGGAAHARRPRGIFHGSTECHVPASFRSRS
jgi:septum formation protein